jgi:hypothetical protein
VFHAGLRRFGFVLEVFERSCKKHELALCGGAVIAAEM